MKGQVPSCHALPSSCLAPLAEQREVAEQLRQVEDDQGDRQQGGRLEGVGHRPVRKQVALDEVAVLGLRLAQRLEAGEHQQQQPRSEEHTSELQSLMRISYAVFFLKKKKNTKY